MLTEMEQNNLDFEKSKNLALTDILGQRFKKILEQKGITDIDEFAKTIGGGWYVANYNFIQHPDRTTTPIPRNLLKEFTGDGKSLFVPSKEMLRHLERKLGYKENEICTNYRDTMTLELFFVACGYMVGGYKVDGVPEPFRVTKVFEKSPRIKAYREMKAREAKELMKQRNENAKIQAKQNKKSRQTWFSNLKKMALGRGANDNVSVTSDSELSEAYDLDNESRDLDTPEQEAILDKMIRR